MRSRHATRYLLLAPALLIVAAVISQPEAGRAVPRENQAEKEANLKQQAMGALFHRWTFDQQKPDEALGDFSQVGFGDGPVSVWAIGADEGAPTPPGVLTVADACQADPCFRMLVANKLQYEYPDVTVRMRFPDERKMGQGGILIGLQDPQNFYAGLVNLAEKKLEIIRVLRGQVTVLGHTSITPKSGEWHTLRIQRNTIISKDVIEAFFDGLLVLSVQDQSLGLGLVGLVASGKSSLHFDSLHAVPLFSHRPLSAPAAY